jgi:hypothetical protein
MKHKKIKKTFDDFLKEQSELDSKKVDKILSEIDFDSTIQSVKESSLTRLWYHSEKYDIAMITAFRKKEENCFYANRFDYVKEYSLEENKQRNLELKAVLLKKGWGITNIKGSYIENFEKPNAIEVSEESFFVVNLNNDTDFKDFMFKLGRYFCQDSILYKEKNKEAVLIGTNYCDFPGYNKEVKLGKFKGGKDSEFMSKVNNRPFVFETYKSQSVNSRYIIGLYSKDIIEKMSIL